MTEKEYNMIDQAFQEAEKDDTPFLVAAEDELVVVGDANKTKLNIHDFEIFFRVPVEENGAYSYKKVKKEYKGVFISPRTDPEYMKAMIVLKPFFYDAQDGEVKELTNEQKRDMFMNCGIEIYDAMYHLVGVFLDIDEELRRYMMVESVLESTRKIITAYSELSNETDLFFAK